ncbi:hypothetical protein ACN9MU_21550 [Pseudoduganella sp. R-32]|uniref:hypothetical protein n=1 Tax=Pseudoduganella sp. R-32 TaxID=3404061 RepID=UPI003CF925DD
MPHEFGNYDAHAEDEVIRTRVTIVERDSQAILARLDREMATKADLERAVATVVKWTVGATLGSIALMITVMTFVMNYAPPQGRFARQEPVATVATAPVQPPAIIITIPPGALQWQPAPEGAQTSPRKP